ncbi:MAG TPA: rRNA pseudouridine synthase [Oceanithermus profundus]|uniref:Pseudouridine synthase n=1 Tax=Oceanithermus profundus TaxID=187137 RepID=A0A7C5WVN5_9DEIN|nr:rRNA pseudouridine synthase [Oceanithermus profundus]
MGRMEEGLRLQKYLVLAGAAPSRRKAEELIRGGRVTVNGAVARLGARVHPGDEVRVGGRKAELPERRVVLALHKPKGYETPRTSRSGAPTVYELLPELPGLHPVGRLDRDSEGLLLFTNDGALTQRLTHPRYGVKKVYRVWSRKGTPPSDLLRKLERGVTLKSGVRVQALKARPKEGGAVITLTEGKKREVRYMMAAIGYPVERLVRVKMGPIRLGGQKPGTWRELSAAELKALDRAAFGPEEDEAPSRSAKR